MTTPGFLPYASTVVGLVPERKMQGSDPARNDASAGSSSKATAASINTAASQSSAVKDLDNIYERLNNVSLALKNTDSATPSGNGTQRSSSHPLSQQPLGKVTDNNAASSSTAIDATTNIESAPATRNPNECDPECACQRVLLDASPGACGICGGRPNVLAKLNNDRLRALEDLEIATQRINELAHEKARHVDYIADLETRVAEQAKKIDQQRDVIAGLKNDLSAMNDKFVDQVNMTAEISHSRELVEAELEDLTQKLFTEANTMVAEEKKARAETEKTASHLRNIIDDLENRLASETMQSHELKERIEQMSAEYDELLIKRNLASSRRGSFSSHLSDMTGGDASAVLKREGSLAGINGGGSIASGAAGASAPPESFRLASHAATMIAGSKAHPPSPLAGGAPIRLDEALLAEFRDFATQAQIPRSTNYMSLPYIKSVVSADIEPCLRFGSQPRISSRNVHDAIAANRLQIEEMTPQIAAEMRRLQQAADRPNSHRQAMLWERFSGSVASNPNGCQACGRDCQQCAYRFRMGYRPDSEWIQIDTMCRDRLVAVCEFYGFVRYLRQGIFASRSLMDLYTETIRLRLCMFYARIGAYGYAIDIDPALTEAPIFSRSSSIATHPDSPTALALTSGSHALAAPAGLQHMSPMTAPYINTSRAASSVSVSSVPHQESSARPSSLLAVDAAGAANRYRSKSHEASALPISVAEKPIPKQVTEPDTMETITANSENETESKREVFSSESPAPSSSNVDAGVVKVGAVPSENSS
ncbi:hypothetical protein GGI25_006335 [Coemansia spiralis]|uniref:GDP/GTP exchange factor Sec2 N-terminal domain-containing protein n=2 Tax=Coemansia TaxID=4863 RepID=A0A9W8FX29_9FUNG|nr:hypothetical protein EDC05_006296 [Coemansia umbellata]KAJ2618730.1 hypothetical protein GGI26_006391 [Coemansia sp. RSA 1358]KAJ2668841.1 hypothetical protein GGI25_006335 [Coemansia spiralis]